MNEAARGAAPWVERLARLGYLSRGAVYVLPAVAVGLGAFGAFEMVKAKYRRITPAP